jgi:hypothetical protein
MQIKKIQNVPFHLANKLHGSKPHAKYGAFKDGVQVGIVMHYCGLWHAWDMACKNSLIGFSCSSLKQLKEVLASK